MKMKHQKLQTYVRRMALVMMTAVMCLTSAVSTQAAKISNPRIVKDSSMQAGQKVTYDCVYFGSYPQAEVVRSKAATTIDKEIRNGQDYIVDADLYAKLKKAKKWDKNGDIVIEGNKYRRLNEEHATTHADYHWDNNYHYFKYQPIKWRVLYKNSDELFLLSDMVLDDQEYVENRVDNLTWAVSPMRSWLNGYGSGSNVEKTSFKNKGFVDTAFSKKQYDTILNGKVKNSDNLWFDTPGGADTRDRVFLLSQKQICTASAKQYGFASGFNVYDEARRAKNSSYAKAMGCVTLDETGNCRWWLRSPGEYDSYTVYVEDDGWAFGNGEDASWHIWAGVRPALRINLKATAQYKYAGTVCTDGTVKGGK